MEYSMERYNLDYPTAANPQKDINVVMAVLQGGAQVYDTNGNLVYTVPSGDTIDMQIVGALDTETGGYATKDTKRFADFYYTDGTETSALPAGTYTSPPRDVKNGDGPSLKTDDPTDPKGTTGGGGTPGAKSGDGGGYGFLTSWNPFKIHLKGNARTWHDIVKVLFWAIAVIITGIILLAQNKNTQNTAEKFGIAIAIIGVAGFALDMIFTGKAKKEGDKKENFDGPTHRRKHKRYNADEEIDTPPEDTLPDEEIQTDEENDYPPPISIDLNTDGAPDGGNSGGGGDNGGGNSSPYPGYPQYTAPIAATPPPSAATPAIPLTLQSVAHTMAAQAKMTAMQTNAAPQRQGPAKIMASARHINNNRSRRISAPTQLHHS